MFNPYRLISRRLTLKILLAFTLGAALVMAMVIYLSIKNQREQIRERMTTFAQEMKSLAYAGIKHPMSVGDSQSVTKQLLDIKDQLYDTEIVICDFGQRIVFATHEKRIGTMVADFTPNREAIQALTSLLEANDLSVKRFFEEESEGKRYLVTIHRIPNQHECHHCHGTSRQILGGLLIRQSTKDTYETIGQLRNRTILISVIGLGSLIVIISFLLARLVIRPVSLLAENATEIARGNLSVSVPVCSEDSIGVLARSFNSMTRSIRDRIEYANSLRDAIADPLFMVNTEMVITFMNEPCVQLSGFAKAEVENKLSCREVFHSNICGTDCPLKHCFASGRSTEGIRATITNRTGRVIPIMTSASPLRDARGSIIGAVEIIKDISIILEAERLQYVQQTAMREEEQRKYLEDRAEKLLGTLSAVSNGNLAERARHGEGDQVMDKIARHTNLMLDNLEKMYERISSFNKELEQEVTRRTVMLRERTLLLERANRELRELDRLKSSFLANMSHELRTPMNSIIGYTDLLLDRIDGEINEEQEKSLFKVANNAKHLLQLINDILDMSKIESGKLELVIQEVDIRQLIESIITAMEATITRKGLWIRYDFPADLLPAFVDDDKVRQILTNLLSNAVKFTNTGGITIHAQHSRRGVREEGRPLFLEICIEDTGIGIRKEDIGKLFNKFSQVDVSTSRPYEGTGLGLSIARGLVVLHKGTIWAESQYGKGTRMCLTLPIDKHILEKPTEPILELGIAEELAQHFNKPVDLFLQHPHQGNREISCWEYSHCGQTSCPAYGNAEHRCWLFAGTHCKGTEIIKTAEKSTSCRNCEIIENLVLDDYITEPPTSQITSSGQKTLLAIDDNPEVIEIIRKSIGVDYEVIGLTSGRNAVTEAIRLQPAAITLDVMMPEMNGWQVLQDLKNNPQTRDIPVIILSIVDEKKTGFSLGAAEYLVKPFEKKDLLQKLRNLEKLAVIREVLIIDNETESLRITSQFLTEAGCNVMPCSTTQQAITAMAGQKPDLIVLSLAMNGTNGFDVIEFIKTEETIKNIPLILITRTDLTAEEARHFNGRIQATLNKTVLSKEDLLRELKKTINNMTE